MLTRPRQRIKLKLETRNPLPSDDIGAGFGYFSLWVNTATDEAFVCVNPALGAAVWREMAGVGGGGCVVATVDPTSTDDITKGYNEGTLWCNKAKEEVWVSVDDTVNNARWRNITVAVTSLDNQDMPAEVTTTDEGLACDTAIASTPAHDALVEVRLNGHTTHVGDGSKVADCYFSADGGTNVRFIKDIEAGDKLYWMGSIAGYELAATGRISFVYEV